LGTKQGLHGILCILENAQHLGLAQVLEVHNVRQPPELEELVEVGLREALGPRDVHDLGPRLAPLGLVDGNLFRSVFAAPGFPCIVLLYFGPVAADRCSLCVFTGCAPLALRLLGSLLLPLSLWQAVAHCDREVSWFQASPRKIHAAALGVCHRQVFEVNLTHTCLFHFGFQLFFPTADVVSHKLDDCVILGLIFATSRIRFAVVLLFMLRVSLGLLHKLSQIAAITTGAPRLLQESAQVRSVPARARFRNRCGRVLLLGVLQEPLQVGALTCATNDRRPSSAAAVLPGGGGGGRCVRGGVEA